MSAVELPATDADQTTERRIRLAYRTWGPPPGAVADSRPTVVLLHGSPGRSSDFHRLAPLLAADYHLIAPDLPGFGRSAHDVPDYSIRAHAAYVEALLDELGTGSVYLVGFSMGGGVALHLAAEMPERVRAVVLLSAIGLQDFELLGHYHLNHAVHALQLAGLWLVYEGVPHFGWLDDGMLDLAYARNFYDSDQRPLRPILESLEMPVLVIHGKGDVLVPIEAAREHHRIVPHSELVVLPGANHFMVFSRPDRLEPPLRDFFERVEAGSARRRGDALPERVVRATDGEAFLPRIHGFALLVWMLLVAAATLVSEDLACLAAGLLVAQGRVEFLPAVMACAGGIFVGDLMLYAAGRLGRRGLEKPPLRWFVRAEDLERSRRWFARRGGWVILMSRFLPGTRLPTYVSAGLLRMNAGWFTLMLFVPVALWTPLLVGAARFLGVRVFDTFDLFERFALWGFVAALFSVWALLLILRSLATHRGRRLFVGWWKRKVEWEYWPLWVFYAPVVIYILRLGIRYRCLTLFTAANPGMPAGGGVIGESKSEILERLDPSRVARFRRLPDGPAEARRDAVTAFLEKKGLEYPVVLKPDQGQRGDGVTIARRESDVDVFLESTPGPAIVQEYVDGKELGIFYVRLPDEPRGRIFAVTDKVLPTVTGDGERTLERLVLDDRRAVALAKTYLAAFGRRSEEIPPAGEEVRLVEIGTHCRGAIFGDGSRYVTPALENAIDAMSRGFEGFYFGRYDIRAPSAEAFGDGRDLKVLELNGVTSEATNIYDPRFRLRDAYGILFEQWRLAFEIGARNRERGVEPASAGELLRMLIAYRRRTGSSSCSASAARP